MGSKLLTIIFPYRNREIKHVKRSLDSLGKQSDSNFQAFFADYGSSPRCSEEVRNLCAKYPFITYSYYPTQFQPWNKSRALNRVIKDLETEFCFVADVDMVFHPEFVERAKSLQQKDTTVYFQVGFLEPNEKADPADFTRSDIRKSTFEATGLSMFPVRPLKELRGFDEFYHFWGAEDTDMHIRLQNAGYEVKFYDREILMLHQWHPSYRSKEQKSLSTELQVAGIVQLNHRHLEMARDQRKTVVNKNSWGECIRETELKDLEAACISLRLDCEKRNIDELLYGHFSGAGAGIIKIIVERNGAQELAGYGIRKVLGKKVPQYYNLKEVNDMLLLHLISFYRDKPYTFKVNEDLNEIEVALKF